MEIEDVIGHFVKEVTRRGVDHLVARACPARVCSHCRNDNLREFALTLPCCGRVLCGPCATSSVVYQWETRGVVVCNDCQLAHTLEIGRE